MSSLPPRPFPSLIAEQPVQGAGGFVSAKPKQFRGLAHLGQVTAEKGKKLQRERLETESAVRLQKLVRGFLSRQKFRRLVAGAVETKRLGAVIRLQTSFRGFRARKERSSKQASHRAALEFRSAILIQALVRRVIARKAFLVLVAERDRQRRVEAASTVQRVFRGHQGRLAFHRVRQAYIAYLRDKAALRIQSFWRALRCQRELRRLRHISNEKVRHRSASRIQRVFRGYLGWRVAYQARASALLFEIAMSAQPSKQRQLEKAYGGLVSRSRAKGLARSDRTATDVDRLFLTDVEQDDQAALLLHGGSVGPGRLDGQQRRAGPAAWEMALGASPVHVPASSDFGRYEPPEESLAIADLGRTAGNPLRETRRTSRQAFQDPSASNIAYQLEQLRRLQEMQLRQAGNVAFSEEDLRRDRSLSPSFKSSGYASGMPAGFVPPDDLLGGGRSLSSLSRTSGAGAALSKRGGTSTVRKSHPYLDSKSVGRPAVPRGFRARSSSPSKAAVPDNRGGAVGGAVRKRTTSVAPQPRRREAAPAETANGRPTRRSAVAGVSAKNNKQSTPSSRQMSRVERRLYNTVADARSESVLSSMSAPSFQEKQANRDALRRQLDGIKQQVQQVSTRNRQLADDYESMMRMSSPLSTMAGGMGHASGSAGASLAAFPSSGYNGLARDPLQPDGSQALYSSNVFGQSAGGAPASFASPSSLPAAGSMDKKSMKVYQQQLHQLESQKQSLQSELSVLRQELTQHMSLVPAQETQLREAQAKIRILQTSTKKLEEELAAKIDESSTLKREKMMLELKLKENRVDATKEVTDRERELMTKGRQMDQLQARLLQLEKDCQDRDQEIEALTRRLRTEHSKGDQLTMEKQKLLHLSDLLKKALVAIRDKVQEVYAANLGADAGSASMQDDGERPELLGTGGGDGVSGPLRALLVGMQMVATEIKPILVDVVDIGETFPPAPVPSSLASEGLAGKQSEAAAGGYVDSGSRASFATLSTRSGRKPSAIAVAGSPASPTSASASSPLKDAVLSAASAMNGEDFARLRELQDRETALDAKEADIRLQKRTLEAEITAKEQQWNGIQVEWNRKMEELQSIEASKQLLQNLQEKLHERERELDERDRIFERTLKEQQEEFEEKRRELQLINEQVSKVVEQQRVLAQKETELEDKDQELAHREKQVTTKETENQSMLEHLLGVVETQQTRDQQAQEELQKGYKILQQKYADVAEKENLLKEAQQRLEAQQQQQTLVATNLQRGKEELARHRSEVENNKRQWEQMFQQKKRDLRELDEEVARKQKDLQMLQSKEQGVQDLLQKLAERERVFAERDRQYQQVGQQRQQEMAKMEELFNNKRKELAKIGQLLMEKAKEKENWDKAEMNHRINEYKVEERMQKRQRELDELDSRVRQKKMELMNGQQQGQALQQQLLQYQQQMQQMQQQQQQVAAAHQRQAMAMMAMASPQQPPMMAASSPMVMPTGALIGSSGMDALGGLDFSSSASAGFSSSTGMDFDYSSPGF